MRPNITIRDLILKNMNRIWFNKSRILARESIRRSSPFPERPSVAQMDIAGHDTNHELRHSRTCPHNPHSASNISNLFRTGPTFSQSALPSTYQSGLEIPHRSDSLQEAVVHRYKTSDGNSLRSYYSILAHEKETHCQLHCPPKLN